MHSVDSQTRAHVILSERALARDEKKPMFRDKRYFVYILGSLSGTLYIGVTGNLLRRVRQHKEHEIEGFTQKYEVDRLLNWETFMDVRNAIEREKELKGWRRAKKTALIQSFNPKWKDMSKEWYEGRGPSLRTPSAFGSSRPRSG